MDYDQLIKNWHAKALEEDYFSKFVFEYLAFIAILKKKKFTNASTDRSAIQQLKRDNSTNHLYTQSIQDRQELKQAWEGIKMELDAIPLANETGPGEEFELTKWWNCSSDSPNHPQGERSSRQRGTIHSLDDWENMVEIWYSIRNNLFHGAKDPNDGRDQLLVENGYKTLHSLIEILLSEQ